MSPLNIHLQEFLWTCHSLSVAPILSKLVYLAYALDFDILARRGVYKKFYSTKTSITTIQRGNTILGFSIETTMTTQ